MRSATQQKKYKRSLATPCNGDVPINFILLLTFHEIEIRCLSKHTHNIIALFNRALSSRLCVDSNYCILSTIYMSYTSIPCLDHQSQLSLKEQFRFTVAIHFFNELIIHKFLLSKKKPIVHFLDCKPKWRPCRAYS